MNITYTREYSQVMVANEGSLTDVVRSFYCNIVGTDSDSGVSVPVGFGITLTSPDPNTFVQFADLTPAILDGWVNETVDIKYYENIISTSISNIINPPTVNKELPWVS
jgi:hypothetical protein